MATPGILRALRAAVVVVLVALAVWRSGLAQIGDSVLRIQAWPLVWALALVVVDRALMAYRWHLLLCTVSASQRPSVLEVLRIFFVSTFVGTFLPASVGGDAVRAYGLAAHDVPMADAVASVFLDRLLGVLGILLLAAPGLWAAPQISHHAGVVISVLALLFVCGAALAVAFSRTAAALAGRALALMPFARGRRGAAAFLRAMRRYAPFHGIVLVVLVASLAVQALRVLQAWALGRSLGIDLGLLDYFAYLPLIILIMLLPISISGLGTSQLAFIWLFDQSGVPAADAFVLSLLYIGLGVLGNLPGGALFASGGLTRRLTTEPPAPPLTLGSDPRQARGGDGVSE